MKFAAPILAMLLALASATAHADCTPDAPSGLKVVHTGPACSVTVSWNALAAKPGCPAQLSYLILDQESGGPPSTLAVGSATTSVTYRTQKNVATTYQVGARNGTLVGPMSAPTTFTCDRDPPAKPVVKNECTPEAPTGFTLGNVGTVCGLNLKWNPVARKPACPGEVSYWIDGTANGRAYTYGVPGNATFLRYPTKKNVTTTFQVHAERGGLAGPKTALLPFTCDHDRIEWSPNAANFMHRPCIDGSAPCGSYLNGCQSVKVDKGVLSASCISATTKTNVPASIRLPCAGMIDLDVKTGQLVCVQQ